MNSKDRRFLALQDLGCIACLQETDEHNPPDIHHLNLGGHAGQKRRGDEFTIPLCPWHHRGLPIGRWDAGTTREHLGPSLAKEPVAFRERYGSDDTLLARVNQFIAKA